MPEKKKHNVFVYGTLKSGYSNHHFLTDSTCLSHDAGMGELALYDLGAFPGAVSEEGDLIVGEIYEVDDATLARLDRLEGHPTMYRRHLLTAWCIENVCAYDCWVYVYQGTVSKDQHLGSYWGRGATPSD